MKTRWFAGAMALVAIAAGTVFAEISVTQDGASVTVTSSGTSVTFDRARGGTITRIGARAVEQRDGVEGYFLAADPKAEIVVRKDAPDSLTVVVRAKFMKGTEPTPSGLRAEYAYTFIGGTPLVRCRARLGQGRVRLYADVEGYPMWWEVRVLDFGEETGWKGPFAGETKDVTVYLDPRCEKLFGVAKEEIAKFEELAFATVPRGEHFFEDKFQTSEKWTNFSGTWAAEGGSMVESSPERQFAWTVAGEPKWKDYIVEAQVHTQDGCSIIFLCGRWQNVADHYELQYHEWPSNAMRIVRVEKGERMTLAEVRELPDLRVEPGTKLGLELCGNRLRAYRNGDLILEAYDSAFASGRVALGTVATYEVRFEKVDVYAVAAAEDKTPRVELSQPVQRHAFYREEKEGVIRFIVSPRQELAGASATFVLESDPYPTQGELLRETVELGDLKAQEKRDIAFDIRPGTWRSGDYTVTALVTAGDETLARGETKVFIRRRPNADRMLVNAYFTGDPGTVAEYGFNQIKVADDSTKTRWKDGKYLPPDDPLRMLDPRQDGRRQGAIDLFDECVKHGMWGVIRIDCIRRVPEGVEEAYALKRDGKGLQDRPGVYFSAGEPRPNPWHPKVVETDADFFRQALGVWKDMPAWHGLFMNSETEGDLDVFGNDYWLAIAEKELGFPVPEDATEVWGMKGMDLPKDGIIESNEPHYRFYRWWWEKGMGQGMLHAKIAEAIKEFRPDVLTWSDPALRQPCVRGRLAGMDQILMWNYAWPNISRFPMIADELRLAAVGGQERLFNIQIIVYSDQAIPSQGPHWPHIKRQDYLLAHSSAIMREAIWLVLSRGVSGLSFHGIETVRREEGMRADDARTNLIGLGYRASVYSNPDTLMTIKEMNEKVVQPFGMLIKELAPIKGEVVMLLSTANLVLTSRDAEDFDLNEAGHMCAKLQAAHVAVDPVYEINLEENGLAGYKAIALPGCKVLPRHIYDRIAEFVKGGGIVIADQMLVPKFEKVLTLPREAATQGGEKALEEEHLRHAETIRKELDGRVTRWADCDSPTVVLSTLEDGENRYLFVINNQRTAGDYVGPWGRVLDDGVPQKTRVRIRETSRFIYDMLDASIVETETDGGWLVWDVALGPGEGRIFAVRPTPIGNVRVEVSPTVEKGKETAVFVTVLDEGGAPSAGLLPLRVTIRDSQGAESDASDYYLARDGKVTVPIRIARNDPSGAWEVSARDLTAGREGRAFFQVTRTHPYMEARVPKRLTSAEVEAGSVIIMDSEGIPVELSGVPVGTKKSLVVQCPFEPGQVKEAFLEVLVDDIDEPREATILLNGKTAIAVDESVLGEGADHFGRLTVPVEGLVKGKNTFEFTFADNLGGSTKGYVILKASLVLMVK
ncbi:MAG: hypothetical protein V2A58_07975 [Planctomycetota bacterium]